MGLKSDEVYFKNIKFFLNPTGYLILTKLKKYMNVCLYKYFKSIIC